DEGGRHHRPAVHLHGDARPPRRAREARVCAAILGNMKFTIGWLYPDLMNIYGDRGNILTLLRRAQWRELDASVVELQRGRAKNMDDVDVFFFGGGQDREQALIYEDLREHKQDQLQQAVKNGAQILAVCGGYQLLGHYYQTAEGERYDGIGLIDVTTQAGKKRSGDGATAPFRSSTTRRSWPRTAGSCSARNDGSPQPVSSIRSDHRRALRRQRLAQHLVDRLQHHELHLLAQVGGDIVEIGLV